MSTKKVALDNLQDQYFDWLCNIVASDHVAERGLYRKVLMELHMTKFIYLIDMDKNRAEDGLALRFRFGLDITKRDIREAEKIANQIIGECTVLEMIIALVLRCEETIMDDASIGNRTEFWFWRIMNHMHLTEFTDSRYDRKEVQKRIYIMLNRQYDRYGDGGLFYIPNTDVDLRTVEIWTQLLWYLDTLT